MNGMSEDERQRLLLVDRNTDPPTELLECYTALQRGDEINMTGGPGGATITRRRDDEVQVVGQWRDVHRANPSYALLMPPAAGV